MQITSFTMSRERLATLVPPSGEGPRWVDHCVKVNDEKFLVVDVEENGDDVRISIQPAPFL